MNPHVIGYHGCDLTVAEAVVRDNQPLKPSENVYDWLGSGIYFWENNPTRALRWAELLKKRGKIETPAVIGAVIDLGKCLDLTNSASLEMLAAAHKSYLEYLAASNTPVPTNRKAHKHDEDLLLRNLDCAVINYLSLMRNNAGMDPFDSVRGIFTEGGPVFAGSCIPLLTHVQIAVCNPVKISGFFYPRPYPK